jgi:hypothetical protein
VAGPDNINHIIGLMLQSRSFDHMVDTIDPPRIPGDAIDGLTSQESNLDSGDSAALAPDGPQRPITQVDSTVSACRQKVPAMPPEQQRVDIEQEKFQLEKHRFDYSVSVDDRKFKAEKSARMWSQISTLVPILALIIGFFTSERLESLKSTRALKVEVLKTKRDFVSRQLTEFYYPIELRREKDTAVWTLARQLTGPQE